MVSPISPKLLKYRMNVNCYLIIPCFLTRNDQWIFFRNFTESTFFRNSDKNHKFYCCSLSHSHYQVFTWRIKNTCKANRTLLLSLVPPIPQQNKLCLSLYDFEKNVHCDFSIGSSKLPVHLWFFYNLFTYTLHVFNNNISNHFSISWGRINNSC